MSSPLKGKRKIFRTKYNQITKEGALEILMPIELISQLFDTTKGFTGETEEERKIREQKEDYNKVIMNLILDLKLTDKQRSVMTHLFFEGKTMAITAQVMGVSIGTIQEIKDQLFIKIKKKVKYDFKFNDI